MEKSLLANKRALAYWRPIVNSFLKTLFLIGKKSISSHLKDQKLGGTKYKSIPHSGLPYIVLHICGAPSINKMPI